MVEGKTDLGTDDTHIGATLPPGKGHMATRAHGHSGSVPPSSASCLLVQKGLCTRGNDRTDPGLMEGGRRDQGLTQPGATAHLENIIQRQTQEPSKRDPGVS